MEKNQHYYVVVVPEPTMKKSALLHICVFFIFFLNNGGAQSPTLFEGSFTEQTTDQDKFLVYLDSIDKYLYRDADITRQAFSECRKIIDKGTALPDSLLFGYNFQKIYFELNNNNPLAAYQIVVETDKLLRNGDFGMADIRRLSYIKGFTYMSIGDLESAQQAYYENIDLAIQKKDTANLISSLYSLGQLYADEDDFEEAIKCFLQLVELQKTFYVRPTTIGLIDFELGETYAKAKDFDKALAVVERGLNYLEEENIQVLKVDFLLLKGDIFLEQTQIDSAEYIQEQLIALDQNTLDQHVIANIHLFQAELNTVKGSYPEALEIYSRIVESADSNDIHTKMLVNNQCHEVCKKMGVFELAYDYVLAYNEAKAKLEEDEKRQKTAYLKIKYDSEQKEKDNALLASEITKEKTQKKLLYALIALVTMSLFILFGAFFQNKKYNKELKSEVLKRTVNLRESNDQLSKVNKELDEFNRILSHDLKEPLRGIVGFSKLATKVVGNPPKTSEYLGFIERSGLQLSQLIQDIDTFHSINQVETTDKISVDVNKLIHNIVDQLKENYTDKTIEVECNELGRIVVVPKIINTIFRNLLANAVIFNVQQVVSIKVNYQLVDQTHRFEIEDNGIGIAPEYQNQIFGMFKRLNNRSLYSGSGLGLSITKSMVEKLNGEVSVLQSEEKKGSTFVIQFPKEYVEEAAEVF